MKKINISFLISSLILSGCSILGGSTSTNSSSNSISNSTNDSTKVNNSSIDKTNWIKEGNEEIAINNLNEWVYLVDENVKVTLAEYSDDTLFFNYENGNNSDSVQLFYHSDRIAVGDTYTVSFDIASVSASSIYVLGQEVKVKDGTISVSLNSTLEENKSAVSIKLSGENRIMITNLQINKKQTAKQFIEKALASNNYTLELTNGLNGYSGEFKFFENAVFYDWKNSIDLVKGNSGFVENDTGIFSFTEKNVDGNSIVVPGTSYYMNGEDYVKDLYNAEAYFVSESYNKIPSLHCLNLKQFDIEVLENTPVAIKDPSSLKPLTYMIDEYYSSYYYAGVKEATVMINSDGNLEITMKNIIKEVSTFVLKDINNTKDAALESFMNSSEFAPQEKVELPLDENLKSIFNSLNSSNYTIQKPDGSIFCINDSYIYNEVKDLETNTSYVTGYVLLADGIYDYTIENGEFILGYNHSLDENEKLSIADFGGLIHENYFKDPASYVKNGNVFEYTPSQSDFSYYKFGTNWLNQYILGVNKITLINGNDNITINVEFNTSDESKENIVSSIESLIVYNIGNSSLEVMEEYLGSNY